MAKSKVPTRADPYNILVESGCSKPNEHLSVVLAVQDTQEPTPEYAVLMFDHNTQTIGWILDKHQNLKDATRTFWERVSLYNEGNTDGLNDIRN